MTVAVAVAAVVGKDGAMVMRVCRFVYQDGIGFGGESGINKWDEAHGGYRDKPSHLNEQSNGMKH